MLTLGLLIPFGVGPAAERIAKTTVALASDAPVKHVTLIHDGLSDTVETRASDAEELLAERGLSRTPQDSLDVSSAGALRDGETITYRAAVPVTIVVDGAPRAVRSSATTVGQLLRREAISFDAHDRVTPAPGSSLDGDAIVMVDHVRSWTVIERRTIAAPVIRRFAFTLKPGVTAVLAPGQAGIKEFRYVVSRNVGRASRRSLLVARVLRAPKARIVAEGVGEYTALSELAERGIVGTLRLANSALAMVATAYTAHCAGCSGTTATGSRAGHGIVAVDPRVIPLGTRMFIPGYGHAVAGDTGGAIRGRRIDLGFNSDADAFRFGRRPVTVYLIK